MTFDQILPKLRQGDSIARMRWAIDYHVYFNRGMIFSNRVEEVEQYQFDTCDILANDWYVFDQAGQIINDEN